MTVSDYSQGIILAIVILGLLLAEGIGYLIFIRPHRRQIGAAGQVLMLLMVLTLSGGFFGPFGWWFALPGAFAWQLPPLASRMLASAGWTFALISLAALAYPSRKLARLYVATLGVYMLPLTLVLGLLHLDRLDFQAPITYPFLAVVFLIDALALWFLFRLPPMLPPVRDTTATGVRIWLLMLGFVTAFWGAALFVTDAGPVEAIWIWPGDGLTSRLIAVMLLTLAVGSLMSLRSRPMSRVMLGAGFVYGFGVAAANLWSLFTGGAPKPAYLVFFTLVGSISALLWLAGLFLKKPGEAPSG